MTKKSFFIAAAVILLIAGVIIGCMLLSGEKETRKNISKIDPDALPVNIRTASYAYDIYQEYAPKMMSAEEVEAFITEKFADIVAGRNKGMIMKNVMPELKGKAEGSVINQVVAKLCQ